MATESVPSLYDRLGGVYRIATVINDFIDRIMVDPRLNANPRVDEAHHRLPPAGFKYLVTEMVCWATGHRESIPRCRSLVQPDNASMRIVVIPKRLPSPQSQRMRHNAA